MEKGDKLQAQIDFLSADLHFHNRHRHMNQGFFTVSELNGLIQEVLTRGFPQAVWICGEIQGFDRHKDKKHVFFELCEKDAISNQVIARIGLVIFAGKKTYLEEVLKQAENAFQLKDDIEVKFLCRVDFYPPHGAVRLIVEDMDPVYTLGKIAQGRQRIIALLKQKGLLDKNKSLQLTPVPLNIGLITAYDSAAYNDFISELKKSGYAFRVFHRNSIMQGKRSEKDICRALDVLNRIEGLDVIVVTRGGGSIAELSCFDSQAITERVASSRLPVLSGIGHEINLTITDMAAHTFQKTPTAVAQFLVERVRAFLTTMEENVFTVIHRFDAITGHQKERLKNFAFALQTTTIQLLKSHHHLVSRVGEDIKRQPRQWLSDQRKRLAARKEQLRKTATIRTRNEGTAVTNYQKVLEIASPANTLKRGFSITRSKGGKAIKSIEETKPDEHLTTQVADGFIESQVKNTKRG